MALTPRLDLRQVQTLVMTPQLQQAIKLLQLSNLELAEFVEKELEQNPLLQKEDQASGVENQSGTTNEPTNDDLNVKSQNDTGEIYNQGENSSDHLITESNSSQDHLDAVDLVGSQNIPDESNAALDADYNDVWAQESPSDSAESAENDSLHWQVQSSGSSNTDDTFLDLTPETKQTLRDHLLTQIAFDIPNPQERLIANTLVDLLDETGYLSTPTMEIANGLGCEVERVEKTLKKVQKLDPSGIGARNLAECIEIQLREKDRFDPAMQKLVENLDLLAKREFKLLLKICNIDEEDLTQMIEEIRSLNPKPALCFEDFLTQPITPDVIIKKGKEEKWSVELNNDNLPRILVNNRYYSEVSKGAKSKKDKEYITSCYQSANWLMRALHQRAQTILKVSSEIVRHQTSFLENGVEFLKPLILKDIAEILDIHESTVSRVTTNKYIATPRGMFELKYFFTFSLGNSQSPDSISVEAIRARIKKLIDNEPPSKILSDDKIVSLLKKDGIEIARRTVAKYREGMKIPSSVQRRRDKSIIVNAK